jgi:outer membrane protein TolC
VKRAYLDLSSSQEELKVAQRGVDEADENYRTQKAMYEAEYLTSTDLIDAEAALTQARSQQEVTFWKSHLAWATLRKATGAAPEVGLVANGGLQK